MKIVLFYLFAIIMGMDPKEYMEKLRKDIITLAPSSVLLKLPGVDYGKVEIVTYKSKFAERDKSAIVILPAGYNEIEQYPVVYINHGIFGNANDMLSPDLGVQEIAGNLVADGEAEKMIIVLTNMWTNKILVNPPMEFNDELTKSYDNFLYDISESLIPFIEQKYSCKTGRENRAITGFSIGGREGIYIGISKPELFGYIGGACPTPGIVPAIDIFMTHKGLMKEHDFKIKDSANLPYILFITGGDNDAVVGTFPKQYSELFTKNGCDHVYQNVPGGGHGGVSVTSHLYNFFRYIFKADKI